MNTAEIVEKIKKLQRLAESPNVHEASVAAAMAQKLIEKHRIEASLLVDVQESTRGADEPIVERNVFTFDGPKVTTWILELASGICAMQGVKVFYVQGRGASPLGVDCPVCKAEAWGRCRDDLGYGLDKCHSPRFTKAREEHKRAGGTRGTITGVGVAEDLDVSEAMIAFLVHEIERLHEVERPRGLSKSEAKTWGLSFRNGAVITIKQRLREAQREQREQMEEAARLQDSQTGQTYALVRLQNAIAHVDLRLEKADEWANKKHKLRTGKARSLGNSAAGFEAGRKAGHKADLQGHKRPRLNME